MNVIVNGYNHITTKEKGEKMTIVDVTSDIPFSNGDGFQNLQLFLKGHNTYTIGQVYEAETQTFMSGNELKTRVVNLINS